MKKIFFIFFLNIFVCSLYSQNISGRIINSQQQPIEYATIIIQSLDSTFLDATTSDSSGNFISNIQAPKAFRLNIQHLSYITQLLNYMDKPNVGTIVLQPKNSNIGEVVVKAQRPLVKVENSRLTYDLVLIQQQKVATNAYEVFLEIPGVQEVNGNVTLAGANSFSIIINGKPNNLSNDQIFNMLKGVPASMLQKAEVMYSAPPEFHVRGAAINLIFQSSQSDEKVFQGEVNMGYMQKFYSSFFGGLSLLYNTPKYSINVQYSSPVTGKFRNTMEFHSAHLYNDSTYNINQNSIRTGSNSTHNINFDLNYKLDKNNSLDISYYGELTPKLTNTSYTTSNDATSLNNKTAVEYLNNIDLNYSSDKLGIQSGMDYTSYKTFEKQNFNSSNGDENLSFITNATQNINKVKIYFDKTHNLKNSLAINYGVEYNYAKDFNSQIYNDTLADKNTSISYNEHLLNIYAGFQKSFNQKLSGIFILNEEYYQLASYKKWTFYPSFSMTYVKSQDHIFQLVLSTDKTYPSYWEIQNSVQYLNNYILLYGNPTLKPYNNYTSQFVYILKSKYIFTPYVSIMPNYFTQLPYQSSESLNLIYQTINFNYSHIYGLDIILPVSYGSVGKTQFTINGFYKNDRCDDYHGISFDRGKYILYSNIDNTINISKKPNIVFQLSAFYMTPAIQGIYDLSSYWSVNAGLKWVSNDNKFELSLKGNDLFNTSTPTTKIVFGTQNLSMNLNQDTRSIKLVFRYRFGGYKEKENKPIDTSRFGIGGNQ